jgi:XTP/dITP diphosphohydrolase
MDTNTSPTSENKFNPDTLGLNKMLSITLGTKNEGKRLELTHWAQHCEFPVMLVTNPHAEEIEETGSTFLENARLKASQTKPITESGLVLAEDSGLVVDALDGQFGISPFPGLYSNRWLTPSRYEAIRQNAPAHLQNLVHAMPLDRVTENGMRNQELCAAILALMDGQLQRRARYCCVMVLWHSEKGLLFETLESTELWVLEGLPRGTNGFGYDPIMLPMQTSAGQPDLNPDSRTMAELTTEEKNRISHRGAAFQKVLDYLASLKPDA